MESLYYQHCFSSAGIRAGQEGIEELERQTVNLLSFQPIAQPIFDAQVAFNVLDRYGESNSQPLAETRKDIARNIAAYLDGRASVPADTTSSSTCVSFARVYRFCGVGRLAGTQSN